MKTLQEEIVAAKKSVESMWKAKIESQKQKIDTLKESLKESESNLEEFRSNWIKEKEQNEQLWKYIETLQRRFCSLTSAAVHASEVLFLILEEQRETGIVQCKRRSD